MDIYMNMCGYALNMPAVLLLVVTTAIKRNILNGIRVLSCP